VVGLRTFISPTGDSSRLSTRLRPAPHKIILYPPITKRINSLVTTNHGTILRVRRVFLKILFSVHRYVQSGCAHWAHGNHAGHDCFHGRSKCLKVRSSLIDNADIFNSLSLAYVIRREGTLMLTLIDAIVSSLTPVKYPTFC
jgi:hypothetical protein